MSSRTIKRLTIQLTPYLMLGFAIALLIGICILLSYILVWGLLIGVILWIIARIKLYLKQANKLPVNKTGRIIEHDDNVNSK
jgi:uncharacterized membrane protein